jgi:sec-independent protein translocase protein TatC
VSESGEGDSFVSHLLELRARLLRAVLAVLLCFCALLPFSNQLYTWLVQPLVAVLPSGGHVIAVEVASGFTVPMRLAFFASLMLAMPMVLYQLWAFVAPGLYAHEKRLARPLLVAATFLFYAGCAFAWFAMLPMMFAYFAATTPEGVQWMPDMGHILDFVMVILLGGGVSFEVPVAVMIAVILGWVKPAQLSAWRGYVIVAIFIIAAIITPPDGLTQIMLALPMCLLYELGLLCARALARPETPAAES